MFGFIGNLFGGGTKVSQTAQNAAETNVSVDIKNVLDLAPIAAVLEWLGLKDIQQQELNRETAAKLAQQGSLDAQAVMALVQEQNQQKQKVLDAVAPWAKGLAFMAALVMGAIVWKIGKKGA